MANTYKPGLRDCVRYVADQILKEDPELACVLAHSNMEDYLLPCLPRILTWEIPEPAGEKYPDGSKTLDDFLEASLQGKDFWEEDDRDRNHSFVDYLTEHCKTFSNDEMVYWCMRKSPIILESVTMLQNLEDIEYTGQGVYENTVLSLNQILDLRLAAGFISALKVSDKHEQQ